MAKRRTGPAKSRRDSSRLPAFPSPTELGLFLSTVLVGMCILNGAASADEIQLRGGGQVQGKVAPDPNDPTRVQLWLLNSKKPLSFQKQQILRVIPKASPLDDYLKKKAELTPDAKAQFELGEWCEQNELAGLALSHYEAAVTLDRGYEPAHQKLGHVFHDGHWLTHDELRRVPGLIKYKGRWITPEEKSQVEGNAKTAVAHNSLVRRIRLLRQSMIDGPEDRRLKAEEQLMQFREPNAIHPLIRVFGNDVPEFRKLLVRAIGEIPGPEAASALVARLLVETDQEVRQASLDQLKLRNERNIELQLSRALHSSNIAVINRAAWAIGHLGFESAVPKLISALITTEEQTVWANPDGRGLLNNAPPVSAGSMGFAAPSPSPGFFLSANGSSFAVMTPPIVGPGVVANGAIGVPWFYDGVALGAVPPGMISPNIPAMTPGASTYSPNRGPVPRIVAVPYENLEVHDALVRLTQRDFEYNVSAWRAWMNREFNPNAVPVRKVPQP